MIYVDNAFLPFGRMKMCHMVCDGHLQELHDMAQAIGMKREWFQDGSTPHYDVSMTRRKDAVERGATEVTTRKLVIIIREWRKSHGTDNRSE